MMMYRDLTIKNVYVNCAPVNFFSNATETDFSG